MMKLRMLRNTLASLLLLLVIAACDSPIEPGTHAAGVILVAADGAEAARVNFNGGAITGRLQVGVGQTATYRVRGIDEEGGTFAIDGTEYSIRNPSVLLGLRANIRVESPDRLVLTGVGADNTTVRFQLFHGDHEEYDIRGLPLTIQ